MALIVPVACGADDAEDALAHRHRYNIAQACALGRAGAEVELIVDAPFDRSREIERNVWMHYSKRPRAPLPISAHLIGRAVRDHADVIHVFHLLAVKSQALAALAPAQVFAEYNGGAVPDSALRRRALALATRRFDGAFFTARDAATPFKDAGALARSLPIYEVPELSSLLEPSIDRVRARRELELGDAFVVLAVARLASDKLPFVALDAFRAIAKARPNAMLIWAFGKDELGGAVQRAAGDLVARFEERVVDMSRLYAAADVMIHSTRRETCSAVFIEALQHGLPVAAADIPPLVAMSGPGVRLAKVGDAQALARAALMLAEDPRAGADARGTYEAHLSYDAIARRKLEAYALTNSR